EAADALAALGHEVVLVTRATTDLPAGVTQVSTAVAPAAGTTAGPAAGTATGRATGTVVLHAVPAGHPDLRKEALPGVISEFAARVRALGPFDAIHAHYWLSGLAALDAVSGTDQIPAITFHTLGIQKNERLAPGDQPEPKTRLDAERELALRCFVVAASQNELAAVAKLVGSTRLAGTPPHGSEVVHPGVDTDLFYPAPHSAAHPLRITVLGRVQPLKGQDLAVRAMGEFARLSPELSAHTELVIAGEPTPGAEAYAASLRELAATYGITDQVAFLPAQTRAEAAALLAASAIVLVPSHSETFGLTALEAGAAGVPVIVGGHTGLLEAAPEHASGIHMSGRDPLDWARAIAALLADPQRRAEFSRTARTHAETHSWIAHASALERIYAAL
ncbi:MAG: glycosyltransferase, partial [Leucobacter sp.]